MMFNRKDMAFLRLKIKNEYKKGTVLSGYLLGSIYAVSMSLRYGNFASGLGIHIVEPFLLLTNSWNEISFLMLGYFLIMSGAPFTDNLTLLSMIRLKSRGAWLKNSFLFVFLQTLAYWFCMVSCSMLPCLLQNWSGGMQWSRTIGVLINIRPIRALTEYSLPLFDPDLMQIWSPWQAASHSFMLMLAYSMIIALFMFLFNLGCQYPVGNVTALGIHFWGILLIKNSFMKIPKASLLANAILSFHCRDGLTMGGTWLLFAVILLVLVAAISLKNRTCSYREANSERYW